MEHICSSNWIFIDFFSDDHTSTIKKAFRHAHSYRGGGDYGTFGGHDIALLELDQPIVSQIACLPSPSYKDEGEGVIGSLAGIMLDLVKTRWSCFRIYQCLLLHNFYFEGIPNLGYGRYLRDQGQTCQTNQFGKFKHHYCSDQSG